MATLLDGPLAGEGDGAEVGPEPDGVAPDVVEADDVPRDGLSCDDAAVVDDDPDVGAAGA